MEGKGVTVKEWRLKGKRKEEKGRDLLYDQFHNLKLCLSPGFCLVVVRHGNSVYFWVRC